MTTSQTARTPLALFVQPLRDQPARKEHQRANEERESDRARIGVRQVDRCNALHHADDQRTENRTVDVPEPAQDDGRERVQHLGLAHLRREQVDRSRHGSGRRRQGRSQNDARSRQAIRVDADCGGDFRIL
jgi:hypothetical protein